MGPFQFHTGSIKSIRTLHRTRIKKMFQFHTGSIKSTLEAGLQQWKSGFNSILVRLKGSVQIPELSPQFRFQFHTGSIKSYVYETPAFTLEFSFNSILVRLKGYAFS